MGANTTHITYRQRVLRVVQQSQVFLTGHQIATLSGLTYRQTIDALNALNNLSKVSRTGSKFTARWGRVPVEHHGETAVQALERAFRGFMTR